MEGKLTEEQNKEIEDKITAYAKAGVYSISKREQADFKRLVLEHEEIAKKVYRETVWSREHILMFLALCSTWRPRGFPQRRTALRRSERCAFRGAE